MTTATDLIEGVGEIGQHYYYIEEDVIVVRFKGNISLKEVSRFIEIFNSLLKKHKRALLISDLSHASTIDQDARRHIVDWTRQQTAFATAAVSAGFMQRALTSLMVRALKLISGKNTPLAFFQDKESARAWLSQQRENFIAAQAKQETPK